MSETMRLTAVLISHPDAVAEGRVTWEGRTLREGPGGLWIETNGVRPPGLPLAGYVVHPPCVQVLDVSCGGAEGAVAGREYAVVLEFVHAYDVWRALLADPKLSEHAPAAEAKMLEARKAFYMVGPS